MYRDPSFYAGVRRTLFVQTILALCVWIYFYYDYENITKNASISEEISTYQHYIAEPVEAAQIVHEIQEWSESLRYQWIFGDILIDSTTEWTTLSNTTTSVKNIHISPESVDVLPYVMYQYDNALIDSQVGRYFIEKGLPIYNQFIRDLPIINNYVTNPIVVYDRISENFSHLYDLIASGDYAGLVRVFESIENSLQNVWQIVSLQTNFTDNEEFHYLFSKIHIDSDDMYRTHIENISTLFGINPTLIKAAVMTEQIRAFYTYRGYIKSIIKSNKFIMVMSQMSYGIGGIKEWTAMRIEEYFYNNYPDIYTSYFAYAKWYLPYQYTSERIARLTQTDDYFYQILYIGGLIKMILDNWSSAGVDISSQPGIILTLYNFGDKAPHGDPQVWWAEIVINGRTYSFGWLGMLLYYILEIYG